MNYKFSDDTFGAVRYMAHKIVGDLLESWAPDRKEEIVQNMKRKGADLVEHALAGDFDIALWYYPKQNFYAVSLNSGQEDPTNPQDQMHLPKSQWIPWGTVLRRLHKWVDEHGKLLISSFLPQRTMQYRRMLQRHFLTANWSDDPQEGFYILPD
jgi:hypothetical protein